MELLCERAPAASLRMPTMLESVGGSVGRARPLPPPPVVCSSRSGSFLSAPLPASSRSPWQPSRTDNTRSVAVSSTATTRGEGAGETPAVGVQGGVRAANAAAAATSCPRLHLACMQCSHLDAGWLNRLALPTRVTHHSESVRRSPVIFWPPSLCGLGKLQRRFFFFKPSVSTCQVSGF
jgi:hypothetical protein